MRLLKVIGLPVWQDDGPSGIAGFGGEQEGHAGAGSGGFGPFAA